jgi:dsRNA-specific ribonuclease
MQAHRSLENATDFERFEFLGDAILDFRMSPTYVSLQAHSHAQLSSDISMIILMSYLQAK